MSMASRTILVHCADMDEESLVQFKLMLPANLKKQVESRAKQNRRSLSQEIVVALESHYARTSVSEETADAMFNDFAALLEAKIVERLKETGWTPPET